MSPETPSELAETLKSLDQALEEFRQIKDQIKGRNGSRNNPGNRCDHGVAGRA